MGRIVSTPRRERERKKEGGGQEEEGLTADNADITDRNSSFRIRVNPRYPRLKFRSGAAPSA